MVDLQERATRPCLLHPMQQNDDDALCLVGVVRGKRNNSPFFNCSAIVYHYAVECMKMDILWGMRKRRDVRFHVGGEGRQLDLIYLGFQLASLWMERGVRKGKGRMGTPCGHLQVKGQFNQSINRESGFGSSFRKQIPSHAMYLCAYLCKVVLWWFNQPVRSGSL